MVLSRKAAQIHHCPLKCETELFFENFICLSSDKVCTEFSNKEDLIWILLRDFTLFESSPGTSSQEITSWPTGGRTWSPGFWSSFTQGTSGTVDFDVDGVSSTWNLISPHLNFEPAFIGWRSCPRTRSTWRPRWSSSFDDGGGGGDYNVDGGDDNDNGDDDNDDGDVDDCQYDQNHLDNIEVESYYGTEYHVDRVSESLISQWQVQEQDRPQFHQQRPKTLL